MRPASGEGAAPVLSPEELRHKRARLPARGLPFAYWGLAHVALATAFLLLLVDPRGIAGFYYHPRMVAVVHLVTLGWITCSILGALYLIAPMALRARFAARAIDWAGFALVAIGVAGMVGHFWIAEPAGMAWAAGTLVVGLGLPSARFLGALARSPLPQAVKLPFRLAFANLSGAAAMGFLLGLHKATPFLPGYVLAGVWAHAHLAALGWATMMVVAAGYRLLPMFLPAAMPTGRGVAASAWALEAGAVGLFVTLLTRSRWVVAAAAVALLGLGLFFDRVRRMLRERRKPPRGLRRPDLGVAQALLALGYLAAGAALGLALAAAPPAPWKLPAALVYGVLVLVGFLSQVVVGIASRLLPLHAWLWAYAEREFAEQPPSPHDLSVRPLQVAVFILWAAGVPALAAALAADRIDGLRLAAALLLGATLLGAAHNVLIARHALPRE